MDTCHTFVFDCDDTLLATNWTYDEAYTAYLNYLHQILPARVPNLHDTYERLLEIEAELVPDWGVKRGRVAESMVRLYLEICDYIQKRYGEVVYRVEHENSIRQIGDRPFDYTKHTWLPNVKETLQVLKDRGHRLCLLTSYDLCLFPKRAKFLGFDRFFEERIRCIETKKTTADFTVVSGWSSPIQGLWYVVGNGESDIRPALDIAENWYGIYIPHRSTSPFFNRDRNRRRSNFDAIPIEHPRVTNIRTFPEILSHI